MTRHALVGLSGDAGVGAAHVPFVAPVSSRKPSVLDEPPEVPYYPSREQPCLLRITDYPELPQHSSRVASSTI